MSDDGSVLISVMVLTIKCQTNYGSWPPEVKLDQHIEAGKEWLIF